MTGDGGDGAADGGAGVDALRERVAGLVADWDGVASVTMFGRPSFTVHEELFCVVSEQGVSLTRLPPADREMLEALVDVTPYDADGRAVERWETIAPADLPDDETLARFLRASYEAALADASG